MVKAIHPKTKDMTEEGLQQWRDGKMRLYKALQPSGLCDACVHGIPLEEFCADCVTEASATRLDAHEQRLETLEAAVYELLRVHYRKLLRQEFTEQENNDPNVRFTRAEVERIEPILLKLKEMVVTP